jgi:hypothetical protein
MIFFEGDFSPPTYVSVPNISMYPLVYKPSMGSETT